MPGEQDADFGAIMEELEYRGSTGSPTGWELEQGYAGKILDWGDRTTKTCPTFADKSNWP